MPNTKGALAEYLRARRMSLKPEDLGYPGDPKRRVPGLRREEVAHLAGISLEYYVRIEQGRYNQISDQVLASLSRALLLDDDGRAYLYRLAFPVPRGLAAPSTMPTVSGAVRRLLQQVTDTPSYVFDRNQDILVVNALAAALSPGYLVPGNNIVMMLFSTEPKDRSQELWRATARASVAALRFHGDPDDPRLRDIVGALSIRDRDFRTFWAEHEAKPLVRGVAPTFVRGFGWIELPWQVLDVPAGQFMSVSLAAPGTLAGAAIRHLSTELRTRDDTSVDKTGVADASLRAEAPEEKLAG